MEPGAISNPGGPQPAKEDSTYGAQASPQWSGYSPLPVGQPVSCIRQPIARAGHGLRQASCSVSRPRSRRAAPGRRHSQRRRHRTSARWTCEFSASTRGKELRSAFFSARPTRRRTDLRGGESVPHARTVNLSACYWPRFCEKSGIAIRYSDGSTTGHRPVLKGNS
jgi:hypothetical protein